MSYEQSRYTTGTSAGYGEQGTQPSRLQQAGQEAQAAAHQTGEWAQDKLSGGSRQGQYGQQGTGAYTGMGQQGAGMYGGQQGQGGLLSGQQQGESGGMFGGTSQQGEGVPGGQYGQGTSGQTGYTTGLTGSRPNEGGLLGSSTQPTTGYSGVTGEGGMSGGQTSQYGQSGQYGQAGTTPSTGYGEATGVAHEKPHEPGMISRMTHSVQHAAETAKQKASNIIHPSRKTETTGEHAATGEYGRATGR